MVYQVGFRRRPRHRDSLARVLISISSIYQVRFTRRPRHLDSFPDSIAVPPGARCWTLVFDIKQPIDCNRRASWMTAIDQFGSNITTYE